MSGRSAIIIDDTAAVLARHHELLARSWQQRAAEIGGPIAIVGLLVFSIWWLGISFGQLGAGLAHLANLVALMVPPTPPAATDQVTSVEGLPLITAVNW